MAHGGVLLNRHDGESLDEAVRCLNDEIIACHLCRLSQGRLHAVPGEGSIPAKIMMIGEAPGGREDELGRPFVGRAGTILTSLLSSIGLSREHVFITSIVKCRPPGNRDPKEDEIAACHPYLERQMTKVRPAVIVPIGRFSAQEICRQFAIPTQKIGQMHGKVFFGTTPSTMIRIMPVYHPAVVTHNPNLREDLRHDFEHLKALLDEMGIGEAGSHPPGESVALKPPSRHYTR